ncbi:hypothetical protein [Kutzneria sp. 744]|uniref:hypothetical protein n=1 Tax=Kutzneria sp. (strain 744) TaxID=345341 RepID=UPI0005BAF991|nr:hypothetical protein [Kutzneria sp. 744]
MWLVRYTPPAQSARPIATVTRLARVSPGARFRLDAPAASPASVGVARTVVVSVGFVPVRLNTTAVVLAGTTLFRSSRT